MWSLRRAEFSLDEKEVPQACGNGRWRNHEETTHVPAVLKIQWGWAEAKRKGSGGLRGKRLHHESAKLVRSQPGGES